MAQQINTYGMIVNQINTITNKLQDAIFASAANIFNDTLVAVILALSMCFYIYSKIGKDWNREDFYKIGVWISTFVCIKAIFSSQQNYQGFLQIIQTPITWVYGVISQTLQSVNAQALDMNNHTNSSISIITQHIDAIINKAKESGFSNIGNTFLYIVSAIIFFIIELVFVIFLAIFTIILKFFSTFLLSLCPFVLPCLIIQPLKGYFYSWLKLFTSFAMMVPLASLLGAMIFNAQNTILQSNFQETKEIGDTYSTLCLVLAILIINILGIIGLSQIPNFVQQIIGSAVGEHKTGVAGAIAGGAAMAMQGVKAGKIARSGINYNTGQQNSIGRSIASGVAGMFSTGLSQKIAGQNELQKQAYNERMLNNNQFRATPTPHIKSSIK